MKSSEFVKKKVYVSETEALRMGGKPLEGSWKNKVIKYMSERCARRELG